VAIEELGRVHAGGLADLLDSRPVPEA